MTVGYRVKGARTDGASHVGLPLRAGSQGRLYPTSERNLGFPATAIPKFSQPVGQGIRRRGPGVPPRPGHRSPATRPGPTWRADSPRLRGVLVRRIEQDLLPRGHIRNRLLTAPEVPGIPAHHPTPSDPTAAALRFNTETARWSSSTRRTPAAPDWRPPAQAPPTRRTGREPPASRTNPAGVPGPRRVPPNPIRGWARPGRWHCQPAPSCAPGDDPRHVFSRNSVSSRSAARRMASPQTSVSRQRGVLRQQRLSVLRASAITSSSSRTDSNRSEFDLPDCGRRAHRLHDAPPGRSCSVRIRPWSPPPLPAVHAPAHLGQVR